MNNPLSNPTPGRSPNINGDNEHSSIWRGGKLLPTGTVTFLFTDIQGSTPLWEREPEKMAEALQIHNAALRQSIEAHGGVVFKIVGDAFQAAFATAPQALKAAIEGQHALQSAPWNELGPLSVRMGLHTGEAELDAGGDEYAVSHTKNRAARIMAAAHGGQVLLSAETYELCNHQLPIEVGLRDLGEHRLKGMTVLERLYQVCAPGLMQDFPSMATGISHPHNLPIQLTSFIGREKEIAEVGELLMKHRLVTLTGSGGTGKTRLSLQVAAQVLESFPNGVWLVELAPLGDPSLVALTAAKTLGLHETPGTPIQDSLSGYMMNKNVLIILDNCEHVLAECVRLADQILKTCPKLTLLATSREILGVSGEVSFRVPSLSLPDPHHLPVLEQVAQSDAVRLFVERAVQVSPAFALNDTNANGVALICQRLDGIPLAIELATARMRVLTVAQIATRLDDVFRLLTGGSRNAMPRHQTLKAAIDWSYDMLAPAERLALLRLSIFTGSCTLEAAEAVCSDPPQNENVKHLLERSLFRIERIEVLDLLTGLVDKSLIVPVSTESGINRYRMLETIRQYAHEKLVELGDVDAVRDRHLAYYVELAREAEPHIRGIDQVKWLNLLEDELGNLRLALEWSLHRRVEAGLRLVSNLAWFWNTRSHVRESTEWLEKLITAESTGRGNHPPDRERSLVLAKAVACLGYPLGAWHFYTMNSEAMLALQKENVRRMREMDNPPPRELGLALKCYSQTDSLLTDGQLAQIGAECLALFKKADDGFNTTDTLMQLAWIDQRSGNWAGYKEKIERRLAISHEIGDVDGVAYALERLAGYWIEHGDPEKAEKMLLESMDNYRQTKNEWRLSMVYITLESIVSTRGDASLAARQIETTTSFIKGMADKQQTVGIMLVEAQRAWFNGNETQVDSLCQKIGAILKMDSQAIHIASVRATYQYLLGRLASRRGDWVSSRAHLIEALSLFSGRGRLEVDAVLDTLGVLACAQGRAERAARLFGTVAQRYDTFEGMLSPRERREHKQGLITTRQALGEAVFKAAWEAGQAMTLDQALAYALEEYA